MTKQLYGGAVLAIIVIGSWASEASAFGRRCGHGGAVYSTPCCSAPTTRCSGITVSEFGRETWYGVHLYEANGQYAGRFENPGYSNVVNYCNGWKNGGAGRSCSAVYSFQQAFEACRYSICKGQPVPAGWAIVGEFFNYQCPGSGWNAWYIQKFP